MPRRLADILLSMLAYPTSQNADPSFEPFQQRVQGIGTDHQPFSALLLHAGTVAKASDMLSLAKTGELYPLRIEKNLEPSPTGQNPRHVNMGLLLKSRNRPAYCSFSDVQLLAIATCKRILRACMYLNACCIRLPQ